AAVLAARDVTDDAAEIGLELAQAPVGAFELMSMGVALVLDQGQLADPPIGLAQAHAELLRQSYQPLARPGEQLGIGREHHRLRLHRRVDHHTGELGQLSSLASGRHRESRVSYKASMSRPFYRSTMGELRVEYT